MAETAVLDNSLENMICVVPFLEPVLRTLNECTKAAMSSHKNEPEVCTLVGKLEESVVWWVDEVAHLINENKFPPEAVLKNIQIKKMLHALGKAIGFFQRGSLELLSSVVMMVTNSGAFYWHVKTAKEAIERELWGGSSLGSWKALRFFQDLNEPTKKIVMFDCNKDMLAVSQRCTRHERATNLAAYLFDGKKAFDVYSFNSKQIVVATEVSDANRFRETAPATICEGECQLSPVLFRALETGAPAGTTDESYLVFLCSAPPGVEVASVWLALQAFRWYKRSVTMSFLQVGHDKGARAFLENAVKQYPDVVDCEFI